MRRRQLKWLWARLGKLASMNVKREEMLMKLGAPRSKAPTAWRLVDTVLDKDSAALSLSLFRTSKHKVRSVSGEAAAISLPFPSYDHPVTNWVRPKFSLRDLRYASSIALSARLIGKLHRIGGQDTVFG
jgi:hypothetical protein